MPRILPFAFSTMLLALSCRSENKGGVDSAIPDETVVDGDGDGVPYEDDCDDSDASTSPNASEICDGVDNDCDGEVDEAVTADWYADEDGDGFGDAEASTEACSPPEGYVANDTDCNDQNDQSYPGAWDICDGEDNDCDGDIDEDESLTWYADGDGDTWGDDSSTTLACSQPEGYVADGGDCNDTSADAWPGHAEVCDEIDNNCDGEIDEGVASVYYEDRDGDNWGVLDLTQEGCTVPAGYAAEGGDCDDDDPIFHPYAPETDCTDPNDYNCDGSVGYADADADGWAACEDCDDNAYSTNPDGIEVCNDEDDDCDGLFDDDDNSLDTSTASTWYADTDTDAYGDVASSMLACDQPSGFVTDQTDCDDEDGHVNPSATEVWDGIDDDCDTLIDDADTSVDLSTGSTWYGDADADGYGAASTSHSACDEPGGYVANGADCDDAASAVNPAAQEECDGIDNDCDSLIDDDDPTVDPTTGAIWYEDADADGYGAVGAATWSCDEPSGYTGDSSDCNDADSAINPVAQEVCDDLDNDCDSQFDDADSSLDKSTGSTWYRDADSDHYGTSTTTADACDQPAGYEGVAGDCNDGAAAINPSASEICDSLDNDCDSLIDDADSSIDLSTAGTWYQDADGDTYGTSTTSTKACTIPSGYSSSSADCNDGAVAINPGASEICDSLDNDCDSLTDDADSSVDLSTGSTWYRDADGDSYGSATSTTQACSMPTGYLSYDSDCDDGDSAVSPSATETCNGVDDDCDSSIDDGLTTPSYSTGTTSPSGSCNGNTNYYGVISVCGCPTVYVVGAFYDYSDGSSGQVVGASVGSTSMTLTWDDCSSGCDCDLDIQAATSWSASKSGTTLTVTVSNSVTGYSAGNSLGGGYSITSYGTYLNSSGSSTNTFTYACSY